MQATLSTQELSKGLTIVSRALSSRNQLPVLANVLIQTRKNTVLLSATNLEVAIRTQVGGKVTTEGELTVPARSLTEFVSSISSSQVNLIGESGKLKITAAKFQASFAGIDAAEFPTLPQFTAAKSQSIPATTLGQIATQVAYAAAVDESRPVLTGVKFQVLEGKLVVVATDGFRLSRKIIANSPLGDLQSLILPAKTVQELARIAGEEKSDVKMELVEKNNQVIFNLGNTDLISRVLEGNYPDTEKIIPTDFPVEVLVDRQEFSQGLKAASIFAREDNNIVKFKISTGKLKIVAAAASQGESEVEVEAENQGEGEIAFNYKFVQEAVNSLAEERIKLQLKDHLSPGVFRLEKDSSLLALVMPVRI